MSGPPPPPRRRKPLPVKTNATLSKDDDFSPIKSSSSPLLGEIDKNKSKGRPNLSEDEDSNDLTLYQSAGSGYNVKLIKSSFNNYQVHIYFFKI